MLMNLCRYSDVQYTIFVSSYIFLSRKQLSASLFGRSCVKVDLSVIPRHIRFEQIEIYFDMRQSSIEEKCNCLQNFIQPHKQKFNGSNLMCSWSIQSGVASNFQSHSQLLGYIENNLLKLFNSCNGYEFRTSFLTDENSRSNFISSLLRMSPIRRCLSLKFMSDYGTGLPITLPIECIANWLDCVETCVSVQKKRERRLVIEPSCQIKNVPEICAHLMEVKFNIFIF